MCLAQGHNAVTPVRLKPAAPRVSSQALSHCAPSTIHVQEMLKIFYFKFRANLHMRGGLVGVILESDFMELFKIGPAVPVMMWFNLLYMGNHLTGTSRNIEDPYEMPHNAASHQGLHFCYGKRYLQTKNIFFKKKYYLTLLDMYNRLSQVYLSDQMEESISIQRVKSLSYFKLQLWQPCSSTKNTE